MKLKPFHSAAGRDRGGIQPWRQHRPKSKVTSETFAHTCSLLRMRPQVTQQGRSDVRTVPFIYPAFSCLEMH